MEETTNQEDPSSVVEGVVVDEDVNNTATTASKEQVPELTAELAHSVFSNHVVSSLVHLY